MKFAIAFPPPRPPRTTFACSRFVSMLFIGFLRILVAVPPSPAQDVAGGPADGPLTLERAIALAMERNERAQASQEYMDAAEARVAQARSSFLPSLSLSGTYTRRAFETIRMVGSDEITIQSLNALSATAQADLKLLAPTLFSAYARTRHERDASVADARESRRLLQHDVAAAFLRALTLRQVSEAARHRLQYARENLAAARARVAAQISGVNDATRAELEAATAERGSVQADGEARTAVLQLAVLLNLATVDSLVAPDGLLEEAATATLASDQMIRGALAGRLDARAAVARCAALEASATEALLRSLPALSATGQYRVTNEAGFSGRSSNWYVGATLAWTIFDGGLWLSDHGERAALARAATLELQSLERGIALEVDAALLSLATARAAMRQAGVARDAALRNASESASMYRQGLATALAAADAGVALCEAEVAYAAARNDLATALLAVRSAAGLTPLGENVP